MAVKNHKLVQEEVELKWLISKTEILKQQIANNHKKKEEIIMEIVRYLIFSERWDVCKKSKVTKLF